jgi:hypothetical protein
MSLNRGEINPLSALKLRKLSFIPDHFGKIIINDSVNIKLIDHWINYNLNSRYAIQNKYIVDQNHTLVFIKEIGIEDPKELTMLSLGCPYLHNYKKELF